jgi:hypothetical protein
MKDQSPETTLERQARRRVALKLGWFTHAAVYVAVNLMLIAVSLLSEHQRVRTGPLLGWGLGLGIHGLVVALRLYNEGWRQRLVEREVQRLRQPTA